jgi:trimeric autotransporter adhesin
VVPGAPAGPGVAVPKASSGWGRGGHRRAVVIGALVVAVIAGGGIAAWAAVSGGSTGYRLATVTRADIGTSMGLVGDVEPVSDAAPSFQVSGKVTSVTVQPGQAVSAGQTLATLDTTALSETVSSDQSTLNADEAKLVEDEENESAASSASSAASSSKTQTSSPSTTTTTAPTNKGSGTGGSNAAISQDQTALTQDQATLNTDQQKQAADLAQAQSECTSTNTATPTGQATCEAALQTVSGDEQAVSKDQSAVSKDETALGQALSAASTSGSSGSAASGSSGAGPTAGSSGGSSGGSGGGGSFPTQSADALSGSTTNATLTAAVTGNSGTGQSGSGNSSGGTGSSGSSDTDTPEQIASDQAAIDTAEAQLTNAQQSLNEATLTSPISGTVVSVGITAGDTVSADSSTEIVTIIGTKSYEVQATLDSSQIPSVKVGQSASVEVDGANGSLGGTVSQVGPVQSDSSGYTYPVVVSLPDSPDGLFTGSSANVDVVTGSLSDVVAVPTSAVQTLETRSYVFELEKGQLTRKVIKIGMVGDEYTQVLSGLSPGQSVVLVDYAEAVPSSNTETNTFGGLGGLTGGGGAGGFFGGGGFGGGGFRVQRIGGGASVGG